MSLLTEKITSLERLVLRQDEKIKTLIKLFEKDFKKEASIGIKQTVLTKLTKCAACNYIKETDEKCPCCWGI